MKRRLFGVLAATAALAVSLAGCSSGDGAGSDGGPTQDPATVTGTLRVLTPAFPANNEGKAAFQKIVDGFHKTYPKMKVEPDYATYANLNEKISTSIAGGSGYDVLVSGVGWIQPFADKGVFADLAPYGITTKTLGEKLVPALVPPATYKEKVYGYPITADARAIGFRKSAFENAGLDPANPPVTFDELKAAAEKLTVKDAAGHVKKAGFDFNTSPGNYRQAFIIFLASTGTPLYKDGKPNFDNAKGVEVLNWMKSMINNVQPFGQQNAAKKPMVLTDEASMGLVGSSMDCSDQGIGQKNCDDLGFFLPDNGSPAEMVGGNLASIGSNSDHKDAAWAFIKAMTTTNAQNASAIINNQIPASNDVPDTISSLSNPLAKFTSSHLSDAIYEGGPANWLDVRNIFGPTIDDVLLGKISAQDGLDKIEAAGK
jgi:multiple sugar transport system substrate-binding protein